MSTTRSLVLALLAGAAGIAVGRILPREAPGTATGAGAGPRSGTRPDDASVATGSVAAPAQGRDCQVEQRELASTRAQLALCMAYRSPPPLPEPSAEPEPAVSASPFADRVPREPRGRAAALLAETARQAQQMELVYVRRDDGTVTAYRPDEWPADGDENGRIVARMSAEGRIVGPGGEPTAYASLRDIAGPDGVITLRLGESRTRLVFPRPDAGVEVP